MAKSKLTKQERLARVADFEAAFGSGGFFAVKDKGGRHAGLPPLPVETELRQTKLLDVASDLAANVARFERLSYLPFRIYLYAIKRQHLYDIVCFDETGSVRLPDVPTVASGVNTKCEQATYEWITGAREFDAKMFPVIQHDAVAGMAAFNDQDVDEAIRAFCESLAIQAYSIFETAAEDLWKAAVNSKPDRLAGLQGKPRSRFKLRDKAAEKREAKILSAQTGDVASSDDHKILVSLTDLRMNNFNLRDTMGGGGF